MPGKTMRLAIAAVVILGPGAVARAGPFPSSGGPGALGTSVPFDSRPAREYFHYYLPTDTPEALRIRDEVQKLHAAHQAVAALAAAASPAQRSEVTAVAQRLAEEQTRIDWSLVRVAKDSLLALSGTAYDAAAHADDALVREVRDAAPGDRDARFIAVTTRLLEDTLATVEQLQPEARKALRQQLGSILERERKLLSSELAALRALPTAAAVGEAHVKPAG
jgi:hypothetical protein